MQGEGLTVASPKKPTGLDIAVSHALVAGGLTLALKKPVGLVPALVVAGIGVVVHNALDAPLAGEIATFTQ